MPVIWFPASMLTTGLTIKIPTRPTIPVMIANHPTGIKEIAPLKSMFLYAKPIKSHPMKHRRPPTIPVPTLAA